MSASVKLPLHNKVQKFSSGIGSPGWSRKKGRKTVVVCGGVVCVLADCHVLLQSVVDSAASSGVIGSDAGILESIDRRGGSVADDVSFSAVIQRIFTKTLSITE